MRIYTKADEAFEEIKRDLSEMGIWVRPKTMQDKIIEGNPEYETTELQNYCYTILDAKSSEIPNVTQPWADAEFIERITEPVDGKFINPGEAWKLRENIWGEFFHNGKFGYSYNELIWNNNQFTKILERLKQDPDSRQLWISLWDPTRDPDLLGGVSRVPCSLGYGFQVREGKLNMHYIMRSCDFSTHFANDVYLAIKLLEYVAELTGYEVGNFTHTLFSLHIYRKDLKEVF
jgi:thymidylate synthase